MAHASHAQQRLIVCRVETEGFVFLNTSTGEYFKVCAPYDNRGKGHCAGLEIRYGRQGWGSIWCDGERVRWLKELFTKLLVVDDDGQHAITDKGQTFKTILPSGKFAYRVLFPEHRGFTITTCRFNIPRNGCMNYWHMKALQQYLKPALNQGKARYNDWVRKSFPDWSAEFKLMIEDPSPGISECFMASKESFLAKRAHGEKKSKMDTLSDHDGIDGRDHLEDYSASTVAVLWWCFFIGLKRRVVGLKALEMVQWLIDSSLALKNYVCVLDAELPASPGNLFPEHISTARSSSFTLEINGGQIISLLPMTRKLSWAAQALQRICFFYFCAIA